LPTVPPEPPHCAVVAALDVFEGKAPLRMNMNAEGACTDGPSHFEWDFGDGSPKVKEQSPIHVYEKPGEYTARIVIDDGEGRTDFDQVTITVLP
jgi:PKD repeat protein